MGQKLNIVKTKVMVVDNTLINVMIVLRNDTFHSLNKCIHLHIVNGNAFVPSLLMDSC